MGWQRHGFNNLVRLQCVPDQMVMAVKWKEPWKPVIRKHTQIAFLKNTLKMKETKGFDKVPQMINTDPIPMTFTQQAGRI